MGTYYSARHNRSVEICFTYAITSSAGLSKRYYYDRAWEVTAHIFGGVEDEVPSAKDIAIGWGYLLTTLFFGPLSYLFLIGEYMV